jgi:hypothetical protein
MKSWEDIQKERARFEKKFSLEMKKALLKTFEPVYKDLLNKIEYPDSIDYTLIKRDTIIPPFAQLYNEVGSHFKKLTLQQFKSSTENFQTKENEELLFMDEVREYLETQAVTHIVSITETNRKQAQRTIRWALSQAAKEGLSIPQTKRLIEKIVPDKFKEYSTFGGARIARTEIISASNRGSYLGAKATGLNLTKEWLTSLDGREREAHAQANSTQSFMDGYFIVGNERLQYPGDPAGSAENIINCRCAIVYNRI